MDPQSINSKEFAQTVAQELSTRLKLDSTKFAENYVVELLNKLNVKHTSQPIIQQPRQLQQENQAFSLFDTKLQTLVNSVVELTNSYNSATNKNNDILLSIQKEIESHHKSFLAQQQNQQFKKDLDNLVTTLQTQIKELSETNTQTTQDQIKTLVESLNVDSEQSSNDISLVSELKEEIERIINLNISDSSKLIENLNNIEDTIKTSLSQKSAENISDTVRQFQESFTDIKSSFEKSTNEELQLILQQMQDTSSKFESGLASTNNSDNLENFDFVNKVASDLKVKVQEITTVDQIKSYLNELETTQKEFNNKNINFFKDLSKDLENVFVKIQNSDLDIDLELFKDNILKFTDATSNFNNSNNFEKIQNSINDFNSLLLNSDTENNVNLLSDLIKTIQLDLQEIKDLNLSSSFNAVKTVFDNLIEDIQVPSVKTPSIEALQSSLNEFQSQLENIQVPSVKTPSIEALQSSLNEFEKKLQSVEIPSIKTPSIEALQSSLNEFQSQLENIQVPSLESFKYLLKEIENNLTSVTFNVNLEEIQNNLNKNSAQIFERLEAFFESSVRNPFDQLSPSILDLSQEIEKLKTSLIQKPEQTELLSSNKAISNNPFENFKRFDSKLEELTSNIKELPYHFDLQLKNEQLATLLKDQFQILNVSVDKAVNSLIQHDDEISLLEEQEQEIQLVNVNEFSSNAVSQMSEIFPSIIKEGVQDINNVLIEILEVLKQLPDLLDRIGDSSGGGLGLTDLLMMKMLGGKGKAAAGKSAKGRPAKGGAPRGRLGIGAGLAGLAAGGLAYYGIGEMLGKDETLTNFDPDVLKEDAAAASSDEERQVVQTKVAAQKRDVAISGAQLGGAVATTVGTVKGIQMLQGSPKAKSVWKMFLRFVKKKAPTLFAKVGAKLAIAAGLAAIPIVGWIGLIVKLGFSIFTAMEIYSLWTEWSALSDVEKSLYSEDNEIEQSDDNIPDFQEEGIEPIDNTASTLSDEQTIAPSTEDSDSLALKTNAAIESQNEFKKDAAIEKTQKQDIKSRHSDISVLQQVSKQDALYESATPMNAFDDTVNHQVNKELQNEVTTLRKSNEDNIHGLNEAFESQRDSTIKALSEQTFNMSAGEIDNDALHNIVDNTEHTNESLGSLANAFNSFTRAFESFGDKVGEKMQTPGLINLSQQNSSQSSGIPSTQSAKMGNSNIAEYRKFAEARRALTA